MQPHPQATQSVMLKSEYLKHLSRFISRVGVVLIVLAGPLLFFSALSVSLGGFIIGGSLIPIGLAFITMSVVIDFRIKSLQKQNSLETVSTSRYKSLQNVKRAVTIACIVIAAIYFIFNIISTLSVLPFFF